MSKDPMMIDHHRALIYTMVLVSASDSDMTDAELQTISENVRYLPAFRGFNFNDLTDVASECTSLFSDEDEDGLEKAIATVKASLSPRLRETAYALACEVVAVDGHASQEELRMLELLRHGLDIDRLIAAGIERGARARFTAA